MTADRARVSYDPSRQYRLLVPQQGRVTLEADGNEAAMLAEEALRLETIDIVGPSGTPDDGYAPTSGKGPGDVNIGPGTFYVGGWRLQRLASEGKIDLAKQPDWVDFPAPALPPAQPPPPMTEGDFLVALLVNEQTVCAVEDQALREVALGGPDSAARTRLMQHFLSLPIKGTTCADGAKAVAQALKADGVTLDPATLQIKSAAKLKVGFVPGPTSTDPCTPAAAGGYLGADNQLVRVTVIDYDAAAKTGTLLWGWNNASIMYRASAGDPLHLTLKGTPIDGEHAPQKGQAVEILRTQSVLDSKNQNYVASAQGFVTTVHDAYSFDTGQLSLTDQLPDAYTKDKTTLFIRLWQATVPFVAGQPTKLDDISGITVTVTLPLLPTAIALRPYWRFAVRPSTPVRVYPQRYFDAAQPPDGPRQWIADIAVMEASREGATLVEDCRPHFVPLTQQENSTCCTLTLGPDDVKARGGLQAVMDSIAGKFSGLSLRAGTYPLAAPLALTSKHAGLSLEACAGQVTLQANATDLTPFLLGLIGLNGAANVTLRRLTFAIPLVPITVNDKKSFVSTGVFAYASANLTVEACVFQASVPATATAVDGAGLAIAGQSPGLTARGNSFVGGAFAAGSVVVGIAAVATAATVSATLDGADISGNQFQSITAGVFAFMQLGQVRCADNRVNACATGLFFADVNLAAATAVASNGLTGTIDEAQGGGNLPGALNFNMQAPAIAALTVYIDGLLAKLPQPPKASVVAEGAHRVLAADIATRGTQVWTTLNTTPAAPTRTTRSRSQSDTKEASDTAQPAAAAPGIPSDLTETIKASLANLQEIAISAEVADTVVPPVLHISGNDVSLAAVDAKLMPGVGIATVFSPRDESGTVLLTGNRVVTADVRTSAGAVLFPTAAAVTGNMFMQTGDARAQAAAFVSLSEFTAPVEVIGNVIVTTSLIVPARTGAAATTSWDFLNTVR